MSQTSTPNAEILTWLQSLTKVDLALASATPPVVSGGVLDAAEDDGKRRTAKNRLLKEATDFVMGFRDQIQADLARKVGEEQQQAFLNLKKVDADSEHDFVADADKFNLTMDVEFDTALRGWMKLIEDRAELLESAGFDDTNITANAKPTPLFSAEEVRKEFFEPLVRSRLMPSTLVFDDMSETMQTFAAANDLYQKRLKKHSEAQTTEEGGLLNEDNKRLLGLVGNSLVTATEAAGSMVNNIAKFKNLSPAERAKWNDVAMVTQAVVKGSVTIANAVADGKADKAAFLDKATDIASAACSLSLASQPETAKIVSAGIKMFGKSANFVSKAKDKDPGGMLDALSDVVGSAFDIASTKETDTAKQNRLTIASTTATTFIKMAGKMPEFVEAWKSGDKNKLRNAFFKIMVGAMNGAAAAIKADHDIKANNEAAAEDDATQAERGARDDDTKARFLELEMELARLPRGQEGSEAAQEIRTEMGAIATQYAIDQALDAATDSQAEIEDLADDKNSDTDLGSIGDNADEAADGIGEFDEVMQKKIEELDNKLRTKRLADDAAEMANLIQQARTEEAEMPEGERQTLKKIMEKLACDRAIFNTVDALVQGTASVAAQFFPGANAIIAYKELVQNFMAAVQHTKLYRDWAKGQAEALGAAFDALASAEMNRVGLEEKYMAEGWVMTALSGLEAIGQTLAAGTPLAPVGFAVVAAAKGAKAVTKITFAGIAEADLRKAWSQYETAIENPLNRKAMRAALRANPTLAKYAIAWAAIEDKNPMARSIVKGCNLTDAVLADPASDVQGVVTYMEMLFNRDPVVLKRVPVQKKPWWPGKIEPNVECWMKFTQAAQKAKTDPMAKSPMGNVLGCFTRFDKATEEFEKAEATAKQAHPTPTAAQVQEMEDAKHALKVAATDLRAALGVYQPVKPDGKPHTGMKEVAEEFVKAIHDPA